MRKSNVAFFFGAGVEGFGNFNLPFGDKFLYDTFLLEDFNENLGSQLKSAFSGEYFVNIEDRDYAGKKLKYSKHTIFKKSTKKKIATTLVKNLLERESINNEDASSIDKEMLNEIRNLLTVDEQKSANIYDETIKPSANDSDLLIETLIESIKGNSQKKATTENIKNLNLGQKLLVEKITSFNDFSNLSAGILDSKFHTIINPLKYGPTNFWILFNYYWNCYFSIVEPILNFVVPYLDKDHRIHHYLKIEEAMIKPSYREIIENIDDFTKILYGVSPEYKCILEEIQHKISGNYYLLIRDFLEEFESSFKLSGIISTNYYRFHDFIIPNREEVEKCHLNGALNFIEFPEIYGVRDYTEQNDQVNPKDELFFPFIFGQSKIKPLISKHQIKQFSTMHHILEQTEILVIMGYSLNDDDNHINSFIRDYIFSKVGHVIYVTSEQEKDRCYKNLRIERKSDHFHQLIVDYSKGNYETIKIVSQKIISLSKHSYNQ